MHILGIETSCDETSASVVKNGELVLSNTVISSLKEHERYGGIIPEIASRRQLECISAVVEESLNKAGIKKEEIDAVAVTKEPGLIGSLLVGISFAQSLSASLKVPLIEVNHIKAHLYASFLKRAGQDIPKPELPAVGLVVSGGHSSLFYVKDWNNFRLIGQTRDDAAGEAFDKVARILELGYPGGPVIDKLAKTAKKCDIRFTCANLSGTLDFSFSGIKTAVLYHHKKHNQDKDYSKADVVCAFQKSVVKSLTDKAVEACRKYKTSALLIGGGVAANSELRAELSARASENNIAVHFPAMEFCLDNGAMIAGIGYHLN